MLKSGEGKYIYCAIESREPRSFGPIGVGGRRDEVYTINYRDLAMVVSDSPIIIYDPDRKNAIQHEQVISRIMEEYTVIPASFGLIFKTEEDVYELLKEIYTEAKEALAKLDNKIELGLKVFWKKECFAQEIEKGNREIQQLKREVARQGCNAKRDVYSKKFQLGQLVDEVAARKRSAYIKEIYNGLQRYSTASITNDLVLTRMVLNAAFLVDKSRVKEFDEQVSRLYTKHHQVLDFKYTGPWPAYNFVKVLLQLEGIGEVRR
ncbi:MAG: GvpL/GvpF family gas vesicle protein [Bacillota bacterium]